MMPRWIWNPLKSRREPAPRGASEMKPDLIEGARMLAAMEEKERKSQEARERTRRVIDGFPVGHRFEYLGVQVVVCRHRFGFDFSEGERNHPGVYCNYCDSRGVIREHGFSFAELYNLYLQD